jgi:hypothetical protein
MEFLDPLLVRGDPGAFDADAELLDRLRRLDRDLVVGLPWAAPPDAASESAERSVQRCTRPHRR